MRHEPDYDCRQCRQEQLRTLDDFPPPGLKNKSKKVLPISATLQQCETTGQLRDRYAKRQHERGRSRSCPREQGDDLGAVAALRRLNQQGDQNENHKGKRYVGFGQTQNRTRYSYEGLGAASFRGQRPSERSS